MVEQCYLDRSKDWILKNIRDNGPVQHFRPLPGATSSSVYEMIVNERAYVLRLYTNQQWNQDEPDLAIHEASCLTLAESVPITTPRCLAIDEGGEHCGYPAVLMTKIEGAVQLFPAERDAWTFQLANALHMIHSIKCVDFRWSYHPYHDIRTLQPPLWSQKTNLWDHVLKYVREYQPRNERLTFIHRDYHPMNVLWDGDTAIGIVDWVNACIGPRGVDVGHCRLNLALLYGIEIANQFLVEYEKLAGDSFTYTPYWDLKAVLEFLPGPLTVYRGWLDGGVTGVTDELVEKRYEEYTLHIWDSIVK